MTKTIHIFTEEASAKKTFEAILPKILPNDVAFRVYSHQGKQDLEKALKTTVPSISRIPGSRILITRDQDNDDCTKVKEKFINAIKGKCSCPFFIRIICKELEAWFLGDLNSIKNAYSRFKPEAYQNKSDFRNVDKINQPNRYLLKIIPEYSGRETLPKIEVSETISPFLNIDSNSSESFNNTISAIQRLVEL